MEQERPTFGRWAIALLLGGGTLFALGFLLLVAFGSSLQQHYERTAMPLSPKATGYVALRKMLEQMPGVTVGQVDDAAGYYRDEFDKYDPKADPLGLIIVTPSAESSRPDLERLLGTIGPRAALIVMPKWATIPDPLNSQRELRAYPAFGPQLAEMLPSRFAAQFAFQKAFPVASELPVGSFAAPETAQTFTGNDWDPLLQDGKGHMLLGAHHGDRIFLLADPDLLNNQGVGDPRAALRALRILGTLDPDTGKRFTFDLSLHYGPGNRNLVRLMFERPFLSVTIALLAAAALAGIGAFGRFGPPRREGRAIALGKRALADNIAALTRLAGRTVSAGPAYADAMRDLVTRRFRAPKGLSDAATGEYLDKLAPERPFTAIEARLRGAKTEAELLRAAQDMDDWRKEVT